MIRADNFRPLHPAYAAALMPVIVSLASVRAANDVKLGPFSEFTPRSKRQQVFDAQLKMLMRGQMTEAEFQDRLDQLGYSKTEIAAALAALKA